ncbi:MAG: 50S ribosomal protein L11 methyltransferase [Fusobacteriaceae bacterium]
MKICEVRIVFESENIQKTREEISEILYGFGATGLKISEPIKNLNPLDYYKNPEKFFEVEDAVSAYFPDNIFSEKRNIAIQNSISEFFRDREDLIYDINFYYYEEEDYQNAWKNYLFPEKISDKFVVKPTWRTYEPEPDEIVIELDPGRAFGTGSHATTSLCVKLMEKNISELKNSCVLDVGTGSGILMIVAEKLGAKKIAGIDIDELAVEVAQENLALNNISPEKYKVYHGDLISSLDGEKFDFVVANILAEVLQVLVKDMSKVLKPSGKIILSGILDTKLQDILSVTEKYRYEALEILTEKEWRAILLGVKK